MSDTTETADSRVREESAAIKMICERVGLVVGGDNTSLAVDFAKIFLSKAPPEFLTGRSIQELVHLVSGSFHFLQSSKADRVMSQSRILRVMAKVGIARSQWCART